MVRRCRKTRTQKDIAARQESFLIHYFPAFALFLLFNLVRSSNRRSLKMIVVASYIAFPQRRRCSNNAIPRASLRGVINRVYINRHGDKGKTCIKDITRVATVTMRRLRPRQRVSGLINVYCENISSRQSEVVYPLRSLRNVHRASRSSLLSHLLLPVL